MNVNEWAFYDTKLDIKECVRNDNNKIKTFKVEALIVPWGKVSRNGIKYNRESFVSKLDLWENIPIMYNHLVDGDALPLGKIEKVWDTEEGLKGILDIDPAEEKVIHKIERGYLSKVSLHIIPEKTYAREGYTEATLGSVVETSLVSSPGFLDANFTILAEMLKPENKDLFKAFREFIKKGDAMTENENKNTDLSEKAYSDLSEKIMSELEEKVSSKMKPYAEKVDKVAKGYLGTIEALEEVGNNTDDLANASSDMADMMYSILDKLTELESKMDKILREESEEDSDEEQSDEADENNSDEDISQDVPEDAKSNTEEEKVNVQEAVLRTSSTFKSIIKNSEKANKKTLSLKNII